MQFIENFKCKEITFHLQSLEEEIINNLSFIHLVMMKFNGDEVCCRSINNEDRDGDALIVVIISFQEWTDISNAKAHCNQNLGQDGNVTPNYKGALLRADPSHVMAYSLLKRALSNEQ